MYDNAVCIVALNTAEMNFKGCTHEYTIRSKILFTSNSHGGVSVLRKIDFPSNNNHNIQFFSSFVKFSTIEMFLFENERFNLEI